MGDTTMITHLRTALVVSAIVLVTSIYAESARVFSSPVAGAMATETHVASTGNGSGNFANTAPEFKLKDPAGKEFSSEKLYGENGMMIMITVPNLTQFEKQKKWEKFLLKQQWPAQNKCSCVVLQDLSQQKTFKEKARAMMYEKFAKGLDFILLIDEDGAARRRFNVQENETVILVVDRDGRVIHHESDDVESQAAASRRVAAQAHWLAKMKPASKNTIAAK